MEVSAQAPVNVAAISVDDGGQLGNWTAKQRDRRGILQSPVGANAVLGFGRLGERATAVAQRGNRVGARGGSDDEELEENCEEGGDRQGSRTAYSPPLVTGDGRAG